MDYNTCPKCGKPTKYGKNTYSGRDIRTYVCFACGWSKEVDCGIALWKAMSLIKEEKEKEAKKERKNDY